MSINNKSLGSTQNFHNALNSSRQHLCNFLLVIHTNKLLCNLQAINLEKCAGLRSSITDC